MWIYWRSPSSRSGPATVAPCTISPRCSTPSTSPTPSSNCSSNCILQSWNLFVACTTAFLCDRLSKHFSFSSSCCCMLVSFMMQTVCSAIFRRGGNDERRACRHRVHLHLPSIARVRLSFVSWPRIVADKFLRTSLAFTPLIVSYTVKNLPLQDGSVPELSDDVPYDPFAVDVFTSGSLYERNFLNVRIPLVLKPILMTR